MESRGAFLESQSLPRIKECTFVVTHNPVKFECLVSFTAVHTVCIESGPVMIYFIFPCVASFS